MLTQTALGTFMLDGEFAKHLRRMHKAYAQRREALIGGLTGALAPLVRTDARDGRHPPRRAARVAVAGGSGRECGARASIGLYGIGAFHAGERREQGVLFGYGGTNVETIRGGVAALAALMPTLKA